LNRTARQGISRLDILNHLNRAFIRQPEQVHAKLQKGDHIVAQIERWTRYYCEQLAKARTTNKGVLSRSLILKPTIISALTPDAASEEVENTMRTRNSENQPGVAL
jgi:ABC-type antimicrobial peptide transport system ATPase subunit